MLTISGDLDADSLRRLRGRLGAEVERGTRDLTVDFTRMTDCPVRLFLVLSEAGQALRRAGGELRLIGLRASVVAIVGSDDLTGSVHHR